MTASITQFDQLTAIKELDGVATRLNGLATRLRPAMANGSRKQREVIARGVGRVAERTAALSQVLAESIIPADESDCAPLAARLKLLRLAAEPMLNEVGRAKLEDSVAIEVFDLLQAVIALVWAGGRAKSSEITQMAKGCYSRAGWDSLFDCRERVAVANAREKHHD